MILNQISDKKKIGDDRDRCQTTACCARELILSTEVSTICVLSTTFTAFVGWKLN